MIICLLGKKQAGKDTIADYVTNNYASFVKIAFAEKIKDHVQSLYNFTYEQVYDQNLKEVINTKYNLTPRQIMQMYGDSQRSIYNNVWVDYLFNIIDADDFGFDWIISDGRRMNEIVGATSRKGIIVKVIREDYASIDQHSSETEVDSIPQHRINEVISAKTGELDKLYKSIDRIINKYKVE